MNTRKIARHSESRPVLEGAGVKLRRAFGFHDTDRFDPFLLLDDFRGERPEDYTAGFPWHPHRGIETITYMLEGSVEHGDSLGNRGVIRSGEVQWMTAGGGIVHQEMPKPGENGRMGGFQLWANLPASQKMIAPRYQEYGRNDFPVVDIGNGAQARVICGRMGNAAGPVDAVAIAPGFFDIALPPGREVFLPFSKEQTVIVYVFEGEGFFETDTETPFGNRTLIHFGEGDSIRAAATPGGVRFLLITGIPIREPVAWGGPIVMNTQAELETAFRELDDGTFLRSPAPKR
jgi:redox-sensitive bicupin YhaK (pirin superfamily)